MDIIELTPAHIDTVAELEMLLFDNAFNEHTLAKELLAGYGLGCLHEGVLVGYALVRPGPVTDLTRLGTSLPGRGVGTALLQEVLKKHPKLMLFVRKNNDKAIKLYRKNGFVIVGTTDGSWVMRRTIEA